jgi:hypothetical protein
MRTVTRVLIDHSAQAVLWKIGHKRSGDQRKGHQGSNSVTVEDIRKAPDWFRDRSLSAGESGGNEMNLLPRNLFLRVEPVLKVVAVFPAARLIEFIRAVADPVFELFGITHCLRGWFFVVSLGMERLLLICGHRRAV